MYTYLLVTECTLRAVSNPCTYHTRGMYWGKAKLGQILVMSISIARKLLRFKFKNGMISAHPPSCSPPPTPLPRRKPRQWVVGRGREQGVNGHPRVMTSCYCFVFGNSLEVLAQTLFVISRAGDETSTL